MVGVVQAMSLFLGWGMGLQNRIQVVVLPVARIARVMCVIVTYCDLTLTLRSQIPQAAPCRTTP